MMYGAPCGGLGSGTIGRGFRGEFCRWQVVPGQCDYQTVPADQFLVTVHSSSGDCVYQSVLGAEHVKGAPSSWQWRINPEDSLYCALYPRSWTVYNITELGLRIICRQVSPVIPHNYKDSCLPTSVWVFNVENNSQQMLKVSITLCFKNGTGTKKDKAGGVWTEYYNTDDVHGVVIHQEMKKIPVNYCLSVRETDHCQVSWCTAFDPAGTGDTVWQALGRTGHLENTEASTQPTAKGQEVAAAVSGAVSLSPGENKKIELCLAWDSPRVRFGNGLKVHDRYYTRYFGADGQAGEKISHYALHTYTRWEDDIEDWQNTALEDKSLPDWFKSAIFNELYYLADGGSVWLEVDPAEKLEDSDFRTKYGRWGYLEAHEYTMYNTYDVHFYASWALIDLFPGLQLSLQHDFLDWSDKEDKDMVTELYSGKRHQRKVEKAVPHDLGDPEEEAWVKVNSYNIHDVSEWKDLNLKMVIQVWRDIQWVSADEGKQLLNKAVGVCDQLMKKALDWDLDRDGLIENSGFPDQTFDSWVMTGASSYCGGLWLSALACMKDLCEMSGTNTHGWSELLDMAETAFNNKLWNGKYFSFDSAPGGDKIIMADQLAGHWYRFLSNQTNVVSQSRAVSSLKMIYDHNVMGFCDGALGAVNGMICKTDDGDGEYEVDTTAIQSEEVWTGVTYGVASLMISHHMKEEGFKTAEGVYKTVYESIGMGFETPEALYEKKHYRAIGYMRPLSIWAMHIALFGKTKQL